MAVLSLVFLAYAGQPCRAAAPPCEGGLTLAKAIEIGLTHAGHRVEKTHAGIVLHLKPGVYPLEAERQANQLVLNVVVAYWNLAGSHTTLYSRDEGARLVAESSNRDESIIAFISARLDGKEAVAPDNLARAAKQREKFLTQRAQALDQVNDNEDQLRALIGLPRGTEPLLLHDSAIAPDRPYQPDWVASQWDALTRRPEIRMSRLRLKFWSAVRSIEQGRVHHLACLVFGNPREVRIAISRYAPQFGPCPYLNTAFWLTHAVEALKDQELKAQSFAYNYYKRLSIAHEQCRASRATREALEVKLRSGKLTFANTLESQRLWADALANEYASIVAYTNALAGFAYARGTILDSHGIRVAGE
jgi:hypothetical protein